MRNGALDRWRPSRLAAVAASVRTDASFAIIDAFLVVTSYTAALGFRLLDESTEALRPGFAYGLLRMLPVMVFAHLVTNVVFGAYGHVWQYASVAEAKRIMKANLAASAYLVFHVLVLDRTGGLNTIPLSSVLLGGLISISAMGLIRFRSRLFSFKRTQESQRRERVLIVGSGPTAVAVARQLAASDEPPQVVGIVADGVADAGRRLAGLEILGPVSEVGNLASAHLVDQLVVAGSADLARRVLDRCLNNRVRLRIVPEIGAVLDGHRPALDVRDLEITDLLSRPAVTTDLAPVRQLLQGQRVLITGAGGSIGREIVRQVLGFEPESVVALDHDETHLHDASVLWRANHRKLVQVLGDVRDRGGLSRLFAEHRPQIVFHAAAFKHVPILEGHADEAVKTNVVGTEHVMAAGREVGVERFVLISSDKAVHPINAMGASKRMAEMLVQAAAQRRDGCNYTAVRFGNVLGSRGSVIPTFISQIAAGGPVTVTDPGMTRYFMTVDESVQLVLQAAALAHGGEILMLDMGEPVLIIDLAHRLIRLAGLVPGRDIEIQITGRRPGEKLVEQLSSEPLGVTDHPQIMVAFPSHPEPVTTRESLDDLTRLAIEGDRAGTRRLLMEVTSTAWSTEETVDLRDPRAATSTPQPAAPLSAMGPDSG